MALWRQIADRMRADFSHLRAGDRLPPEMELAQLFGVNRHTVRAAIAALVSEGTLKSEQGRGTFVVRPQRLAYPLTRRTRFSAGLEGQAGERRSRMTGWREEVAGEELAAQLELDPQAILLRIDSIGEADSVPVSRATSWLETRRFPGFAQVYARTGSITASFAQFAIADYVRRTTRIEARLCDRADEADLALSPGAVVLVTRAVNTGLDGRPIQYSITRFAANRVELTIDHENSSG